MSATLAPPRPRTRDDFAEFSNLWQTSCMDRMDRTEHADQHDPSVEQEILVEQKILTEFEADKSDRDSGDRELNQLFLRVQSGDQAAFSQFYDVLASRVFGLVLRVLADHAQSEEVTQEVFLHAWKEAASFNAARGNVRSWLLTIAHRRAVDRVRSVQSSRERDRKIGARDNEIAFDVVVEGVEERDNRSRIVSALNSLTPVQRECVVMAYYDGFSQREIANNLGVPIGTVKTRVRDGVIRLREMLGSEL